MFILQAIWRAWTTRQTPAGMPSCSCRCSKSRRQMMTALLLNRVPVAAACTSECAAPTAPPAPHQNPSVLTVVASQRLRIWRGR